MKRSISHTICGKKRTLVANFAAAEAVTDRVADIMMIADEAMLEAKMLEAGIMTHRPRWSASAHEVIEIISIGLEQGGDSVDEDDLKQWAFEVGLGTAKTLAYTYLGLIYAPAADVDLGDGGKKGKSTGKK